MNFVASLEKMLLKLLIINPLLNALGLGGQRRQAIADIVGNSGGVGGPGTATTPFQRGRSSSPAAAKAC